MTSAAFLILCPFLTAWARIITRNHTPLQVILGVFTGVIPVLVTFPVLVG